MPTRDPLTRLIEKIQVEGDCWRFTGALQQDGYGMYWHAGRTQVAHRVAYLLLVGPIPPGLTIDHLCRNRACVNPDHLEPVTIRVNTLRGFGISALNARKSACHRGHPFTAANTIQDGSHRRCRTCRNERRRAHRSAC